VSFQDLTLICQCYTVSASSSPDPSLLDYLFFLDITSVRDLTRRDSRTRTLKPDRTMPHHVCEQLRYGYFGDIGQHERSKDRANRTVESLALIVLYRPPPSHTKPRRALLFFEATGRRALLFSEDNKQHATRDAYCSLRTDETRKQQPKIRGPAYARSKTDVTRSLGYKG
jgi:hypothetical protein